MFLCEHILSWSPHLLKTPLRLTRARSIKFKKTKECLLQTDIDPMVVSNYAGKEIY